MTALIVAGFFIIRSDRPPGKTNLGQASATPKTRSAGPIADTTSSPTASRNPDALALVLAAHPDETQAILNSKELLGKIEIAYAAEKLETPQSFENVREWLRKAYDLEDRIAKFKIETHEDRGRLVMLRVERDSFAEMAREMMLGLGVRIYKRALDMK